MRASQLHCLSILFQRCSICIKCLHITYYIIRCAKIRCGKRVNAGKGIVIYCSTASQCSSNIQAGHRWVIHRQVTCYVILLLQVHSHTYVLTYSLHFLICCLTIVVCTQPTVSPDCIQFKKHVFSIQGNE